MKYLIVTSMLFTCISAHAALNKWVDAEGKVHYSDTPPAEVKAKNIRSFVAPDIANPSSTPTQKTLAEQEVAWKKSQKAKEEANQKAEKEKAAAEVKQKNCDAARRNLAGYEAGGRMVYINDKGERAFLDDTAKSQKIEESRKHVSDYCN